MAKQSGHPTANVKNEGLKSANTSDENEVKNVRGIRGGDNGALSDEDFDENEIQQAGGNNNGGIVPGAHGRERNDAAGKSDGQQQSLSEGM